MNYTLNQLHIFLKIAEFQSVTKASEALNLTQPAVSIQLKNFQAQFDIPLTELVGKRLYITEFGREIAEAASQIVEQVHAINYKMLAYKGKLAGNLTLSIVSTGKYVMPYFLADFIKSNPGINLFMDVTNKQKVVETLFQNEVDFALVSIVPDNMKVSKIDLIPNKLYFVIGKDMQIEKGSSLEEILSQYPLIFREQGSGTRQIMERFLERNQVFIPKKMELTSNEAVKQAVIAGLGVSIMPLIGIKHELQNKEIQIIPIKGLPIKTMWSLIWLKEKSLSPVCKAFVQYLNQKSAIVQSNFSWYEAYK
jgi:DNA-binding transcriptional LysR family regulator